MTQDEKYKQELVALLRKTKTLIRAMVKCDWCSHAKGECEEHDKLLEDLEAEADRLMPEHRAN